MTTRRGRKPLGPQLVERLEGSEHAKERLKVMLETLDAAKSVPEACAELAIGESRFHELRTGTLQAALDSLEPRPPGRRAAGASSEAGRIAQLEAQLRDLELQRKALEIQLGLARIVASGRSAAAGSSKKPSGGS